MRNRLECTNFSFQDTTRMVDLSSKEKMPVVIVSVQQVSRRKPFLECD